MINYRKFSEFPRGTLYDILQDAYSFDPRNQEIWNPRNAPEYVEIGHNGIRSAYKGKGYGHLQLQEAIDRIKAYDDLKKIIVCTNSNLVAPRNYESVGFKLYDRKDNHTESAYTGDYLYYEIIL